MTNRNRRGSIKSRSPGSWSIIVNMGKDPETGKWQQHWETIKGTKRQAEQRLTHILRDEDIGSFVKPSRVDLAEYLSTWLDTVVAIRNRPRTIDGYRTIINKHLVPHLGRIELSKLSSGHLEKLYATLLSQGLSSNTVHHVHVCLSKALKDAVKKGLLGRNVCEVVQAPSPGHYEVQLPELEGIKKILELAKDTPYCAVLHFISHTGVRRSEALALSWQDADLERGFVSITRTLQRIARDGLVFEPTKSRAGRRAIDLDPGTVAVLRAHQG